MVEIVLVIKCLGGEFGINSLVHFWEFWNCPSKTRAVLEFLKIMKVISPKSCSNQAGDYCLITPNPQTLLLKLISFNREQLQNSGRLQNNTVNGTMLIGINRVMYLHASFAWKHPITFIMCIIQRASMTWGFIVL